MRNSTFTSIGLVLVLWLAGLGAAAQFAKISVILPSLREIYPEAGISLGFLVSLLSLLGIFLGLFAGLIATRIGFRRLLLHSLMLGCMVSLYQTTLPSINLMLASRILEGFSHLGIVVAAPTLIAQIPAPKYRSLTMTLWGTFFGVAFAVVAGFGVPLVAVYGPSGLFLAHAMALLIIAVMLFLWLPEGAPILDNSQRLTISFVLKRHLEIYSSPFIAAPALGWLFYTLTFLSLLTILPDTVAPQHRTFVTSIMPLASIATSMTVGVVLLRYVSAIQVILLGFSLAMVTSAMLFAFPGHPLLCIALLGTLGLVQGASFAAIPQLNHEPGNQAYANGGMAQMGNIGNACGTPILLSLLVYLDFSAVMIAVIICYIIGILLHLHLAKLRARTSNP